MLAASWLFLVTKMDDKLNSFVRQTFAHHYLSVKLYVKMKTTKDGSF